MNDFPQGLAMWIGSLFIAVVVPEAIRRFMSRGDKADANAREANLKADTEWRAEVRNDLKRLLEGQATSSTSIELLKQSVTSHGTRMDDLDERQEKQAAAHLKAIESLRAEFSTPRRSRK